MAGQPYAPRGRVTFYLPANTPKDIIDFLNESRDNGVLSQEIIEALNVRLKGKPTEVGEEPNSIIETTPPPVSEVPEGEAVMDKNLDAMAIIRAQNKRVMSGSRQ